MEEIRTGLSRPQKELPSKLFYDRRGSELFEEITRLPEYYLTRAERALLAEWAPRWIQEVCPRSLVELGAGNAEKTRTILDAMQDARCAEVYVPVDISTEFLEQTSTSLRTEYPALAVVPVAADFTGSMHLPADLPRPALLTFLGSTIGNFSPPAAVELLRRIRTLMEAGDRFLLGVDLRKDEAVLEAAYNDARGVTAEFNLNLLRVLNREVGADFDPDAFQHRAWYDPREHRIEMHLVAMRPQTVRVPGAGCFELEARETIRTEISCKYDRQSVAGMFGCAGLEVEHWRTDPEARFALVVGRRSDP